MIKRICCISLMVVLALQTMPRERAYADGEFARKNEILVEELHKFFPQVKGTVVSIRDEKVFIDIGAKEQLAVGAQLALFAEGIDIIDPKTQKVLGKYEEQIGAIHITEIQDQFSVAKVLWTKPGVEIFQGMHVGQFSGKIKLAVLPVSDLTEKNLQVDSAYELFVDAVASDERFTVFDEADIKSAAIKAGLNSADMVKKQDLTDINTVLEAHNFVQLVLRPDADNVLAQALLLSGSGEEIGSVQEILREYTDLQQPVSAEKAAKSPESQPKDPVEAMPQEQRPDPNVSWSSETLPIRAHKIAAGDLTGDGNNEVILATRTDLELFEHARLGEQDSFRPLTTIRGYNDALILGLGVADINGNGREEIFLTTLRSVSAEVRVFEFDSGKFKEIWGGNGVAMRIIRGPEGKNTLVGQTTTASISLDFLSGKISEYAWDGKNYSRQNTLDIPGRVKVFGFAMADLDQDGKNAILFYDDVDRIDVFRDGERIWRSRRSEAYRIPVLRKNEDEKEERRIPGRIELTTLGEEQRVHLVLFENLSPFKFIQGLPMYNKSRIHLLRWTGETFARDFQSEDSDGYAVDYAVADVDNDGQQEVLLAKVLKGDDLFKTPKSQIAVYELE